MKFEDFIKPELLVLIPVLYLMGVAVKRSIVRDKAIPFILGAVAVILAGLYVFATTDVSSAKAAVMAVFTAVTQGVLIAGTSVYANQLYKQIKKEDNGNE